MFTKMATSPRMRIALRAAAARSWFHCRAKANCSACSWASARAFWAANLAQRLRIAAAQRLRPLGPRAGMELAAQLGIERVIVEPRGLGAAKLARIASTARRARDRAGRDRESCRRLRRAAEACASRHAQNRHCRRGRRSLAMPSSPIQPQSRRNSRLMSEGLPAKAEEAA